MAVSKKRCAIYTRKSTEEGLDQEFNTLDAQREACEAFVQSQKHEGWHVSKSAYDDGGYSGGSLNRPAMQKLLADIEAGLVDIVVVYKVDRLTRSLPDFAKIVESFDAHDVAFVSVTQQFNTSTSMGRLTLNVLLSFAQFEREVTGERIRDKIAASKRKGMWMGGNVPLGYDNKNRALVINTDEAKRVQRLFALYLETGNVREALKAAIEEGITNKLGKPFTRTNYYKLLGNHLYVGEIAHRGEVFEGLHKPIVGRETWDRVQTKLGENAVERTNKTNAKNPSLLAGKLFDDDGRRYVASHSVKKGKRYRYYIERAAIDGGVNGHSKRKRRIPAHEIEQAVTEGLVRFLENRERLLAAISSVDLDAGSIQMALERSAASARDLNDRTPDSRSTIQSLIERITIEEKSLSLKINTVGLFDLLGLSATGELPSNPIQTIPVEFRYRGVQLRLIVPGSSDQPTPEYDLTMIKAIIKAHDWWNQLMADETKTVGDIASAEKISTRWVRKNLDLVFLPSSLVLAILAGAQPERVNL